MKAFIFDLDGVLTETQKLHALAWERMFNEFLLARNEPLFTAQDYRTFLDGKPRLEGIKSFLRSRNIELEAEEIAELGIKKNDLYLEFLKDEGPHLIEDSFSFVVQLSRRGIPMAVVSSSRNCRAILKMTGLDQLVQVIVDPGEAEKRQLRGKPYPDYFLLASELLRVPPRDCYLVEDAISGIQAGRAGGFQRVIGIKIDQGEKGMRELLYAGADEVVGSLWKITGIAELLKLPDALDSFEEISGSFNDYFLFLDYDGTISEIVPEPWKAVPVRGITELISEIADTRPVCLITGRDTDVIKKFIDLPHVYYSTCHGFEISGPDGLHYELEEARKLAPEFDEAQKELSEKLGDIKGILIERKTFGLAFHFRMIHQGEVVRRIISTVSDYAKAHGSLKVKAGEQVIELMPNIDWDKGKSVRKLYEVLGLSETKSPPLYFGDGHTDEDAFREMIHWGTSVLVSRFLRPTLAKYRVKTPEDTRRFLTRLKNNRRDQGERMDPAV